MSIPTTYVRELVIKHFLNGNSEREIAKKMLIPRDSVDYIIAKYKSTKCIGNLMGRRRRRKTTYPHLPHPAVKKQN